MRITIGSGLIYVGQSNGSILEIPCSASTSLLNYRSFIGHKEPISGLFIAGSRLISTSIDGMIKIWDIKQGICKSTYHHQSSILDAAFDGDLFTTCGTEILKWDLLTGKWVTFVNHTDQITCIDCNNGYIYFGSTDGVLGSIPQHSNSGLDLDMKHESSIVCFFVNGFRIYSATKTCLYAWCSRTKTRILCISQPFIKSIVSSFDNIYTCDDDGFLTEWSLAFKERFRKQSVSTLVSFDSDNQWILSANPTSFQIQVFKVSPSKGTTNFIIIRPYMA
jgi:WD40 repeat protein